MRLARRSVLVPMSPPRAIAISRLILGLGVAFAEGLIPGSGFRVGRVEAGECSARLHLADDPCFESLLLDGCLHDIVEQRFRNYDGAIVVGDDYVVVKDG